MRRINILLGLLFVLLVGSGVCFGQGLSAQEQLAMDDTLQYALEQNRLNQGAEWVNPDTGHAGVVAPTRTFDNSQGQPCREFVKTITIGGREEQGYGTACRQPDGSWQIVAPKQSAAAAPQSTSVYVHTPADRYYAFPPEAYFRFPIYLSFSYVHRHGQAFKGSYHMSGRDYRNRYPHHLKQKIIVVPPRYEPYRRHDGPKFKEKFRYRDDWRYERDHRRQNGHGTNRR